MGLFNKKSGGSSGLKRTVRIVVAGAGHGSGVSFVSELLAFGLARQGSVSLTELGSPHFYNSLGFESRFLARGYNDFLAKIKENEHFNYENKNTAEGISWICKAEDFSLSSAGIFRAFYMPSEDFCIYDCSGLADDDKLALLAASDYQVIVIDPLPSKLAISRDFLETVRFKFPDALLAVNKMNSGVHTAELNRFLGTKDYFSIASVPADYIYKAEYNSKPVIWVKGALEMLSNAQEMVCRVFQ